MKIVTALVGVVLCVGCAAPPQCRRGHMQTIHVEERQVPNVALFMAIKIWTFYTEPAHDEDVFVCDEWEKR